MKRRDFIQTCTGVALAANASGQFASPATDPQPVVKQTGDLVQVEGDLPFRMDAGE